jgi:hypothetical protein
VQQAAERVASKGRSPGRPGASRGPGSRPALLRIIQQLRAQRWQRRPQRSLGLEPIGRHRADFGVHRGVHLDTPGGGGRVAAERSSIVGACGTIRSHFGVADQVFHQPLRLRITAVARVRTEPVVGGEPDVVRGGLLRRCPSPGCSPTHTVRDRLRRTARPRAAPAGRGQYGQRALLRRLTGVEHRRVDEADAVPRRQTRQPLGVPQPTLVHCTQTPLGKPPAAPVSNDTVDACVAQSWFG